ncbi:MAG: hypothetical protein KBE33_06360, partial [Faecalibacterium sp.]|nr:hypothetical protein [Faecalibacterium sp.]
MCETDVILNLYQLSLPLLYASLQKSQGGGIFFSLRHPYGSLHSLLPCKKSAALPCRESGALCFAVSAYRLRLRISAVTFAMNASSSIVVV